MEEKERKRIDLSGEAIAAEPLGDNECLFDYFFRKLTGGCMYVNISGWITPPTGSYPGTKFSVITIIADAHSYLSEFLEEAGELINSHAHAKNCSLCRDFAKGYKIYLRNQNPKPTLWQRFRSFLNALFR